MPTEKLPTGLVGSNEMASLFGVTPRRIQQLTQEGIITATKVGNAKRYDVKKAVQNYIKHLTEKASANTKKKDTETETRRQEAEADFKRTKADIAALELSELQGKMHRSEDVAAVMTDLVYNTRSMLMAMPGRLARDVAQETKPAATAEIIRQEVHLVLKELAAYRYNPETYAKRVREREGWHDMNDEAINI